MITIIHGENTVQSRNKLIELIDEAKDKKVLVDRIGAKELSLATLEEKLQKSDLFGHPRMLVIEALHSLPRSNKKSEMIKLLATTEMDICLWEKRTLTKTMLKKFANSKVHEFKLANSLFKWLDSLSSSGSSKKTQLELLNKALLENDEYLCFVMLARQVRMLLQAKQGGNIKGPGFVVNKIKSQSNQFTLDQLLNIHQQLFAIDQQLKSSQNALELSQQIEQILLNI